jgi:hypothetical protein
MPQERGVPRFAFSETFLFCCTGEHLPGGAIRPPRGMTRNLQARDAADIPRNASPIRVEQARVS